MGRIPTATAPANRPARQPMRRTLRFVLQVLVPIAGALGCILGEPEGPPPDSCERANSEAVTSVTIGAATSQSDSATTVFRPVKDRWALKVFQGGQGASMVGLRFAVDGDAACIAQKTEIFEGTSRIVVNEARLRTYELNGQRVTAPLWLPGRYPLLETVRVTTTVGKASRSVDLVPMAERHCVKPHCTCAMALECLRSCADHQCRINCHVDVDQRVSDQYLPIELCREQWCSLEVDGGLYRPGGQRAGIDGCFNRSEDSCAQCSSSVLALDSSQCVPSEPYCMKCVDEQRACEDASP